MSVSAFLQDLGLFEGLAPDQLERIAAVCVERRCAPGEVIFAEFGGGHDMYLIQEGGLLVQISTQTPPPGQEELGRHTIARLMPGQYVGEQAMVDDAVRSATVVSEAESILLSLSRADVERLCESDPRLGYIFMRNIAQELSFKLRNTGLVMRGELWNTETHEPPPDSGFGFDHLTEAES